MSVDDIIVVQTTRRQKELSELSFFSQHSNDDKDDSGIIIRTSSPPHRIPLVLPQKSPVKRQTTENTLDTNTSCTVSSSTTTELGHSFSDSQPQESSVRVQVEPSRKKCVRFDQVHIRYYDMCLGDNPYCSIGPPVSLSWDYTDTLSQDLDVYECQCLTSTPQQHRRRRPLRFLVLNYYQRYEILKNAGYTDAELKQAERLLNKQHRQRATTQFFLPVSRIGEAWVGAQSRMLDRRKTQRR